ncbi:ABC transporter permease [Mediterraneibacter faecis]|uniref:ABC transporter permease n=1 Tax=Mediterraneibacter faecis TaxID=592978 RepID=UPI003CF0E8DF
MSNLLKTELYKLFHSWYFWGIGIFNLLLSSILLLDSKERSSNLIMASLYNIPLLYFLSIVFIALFIGSDFSGRTLNTYITAGHKRSSIFRVKLIVSQIGCIIILVFPLFVHGIISQFYIGEKLFWNDSTYTMVLLTLFAMITLCALPMFFAFIFRDMGKTLTVATVYKGNIIKNLIMDCQSYTKYRPNETTGGIFVSWRRKEELPTGA